MNGYEKIEKKLKTEPPIKKEIDIVVVHSRTDKPFAAIELKYPRNGQVPEQMYSFIKDIKFAEQLKKLGFQNAYCVTLVDDPLFYRDGRAENGIYKFFREKSKGQLCKVPGRTCIMKPTGQDEDYVKLDRDYTIKWEDPGKERRFYCIEM